MAGNGLYPAVDPLDSTSKLLSADIVGERHYNVARRVREAIAHYRSLEDIISMLGLEELSADDQRIVQHARRLVRFLTQPFFVTEAFTGREGRLVSVEETLDGCEAILAGEFDDVPESALYMIGSIEEARTQGRETVVRPGEPEQNADKELGGREVEEETRHETPDNDADGADAGA
jgi:F-type H+-transporting ATPase subunit beta